MGWMRPRRQAADDTGFVGYSRSNAGTYHDRMVLNRSRGRVIVTVVVTLAVAMALACAAATLLR